jgi:hypothetical protein
MPASRSDRELGASFLGLEGRGSGYLWSRQGLPAAKAVRVRLDDGCARRPGSPAVVSFGHLGRGFRRPRLDVGRVAGSVLGVRLATRPGRPNFDEEFLGKFLGSRMARLSREARLLVSFGQSARTHVVRDENFSINACQRNGLGDLCNRLANFGDG